MTRPAPTLRQRLLALHRDDRGATSTEYMLILVIIVLPIGLMFPVFFRMARFYGQRALSLVGLPF